jgi:hypothetical protein
MIAKIKMLLEQEEEDLGLRDEDEEDLETLGYIKGRISVLQYVLVELDPGHVATAYEFGDVSA